eukprot:CAMPEP_0181170650 /NCGR_PEP_ID=MMETSP1096-20121128/1481_1 /TAXON_ID=156174 ORGANISM="Chrysochromulina ericina, Strain CCMP281" /NCGR_SAMPLE_ID=MMETSP1096 /ASSEMBLY_ACC=CAM_ASM_000453 /LENGTH=189 /DNA_ID=CAMNT_0023258229 /DNA_START=437 /DNA_END=1007 /DNA_ORIENTATION=+
MRPICRSLRLPLMQSSDRVRHRVIQLPKDTPQQGSNGGAGQRPNPPDPVILPGVRYERGPKAAGGVDAAACERDADDVRQEDGEADGEGREVLLGPSYTDSSSDVTAVIVNRGLEHHVNEQRRAHGLNQECVADGDVIILPPVGAEATGPIEAISISGGIEKRSATDRSKKLGDQVHGPTQRVARADKG